MPGLFVYLPKSLFSIPIVLNYFFNYILIIKTDFFRIFISVSPKLSVSLDIYLNSKATFFGFLKFDFSYFIYRKKSYLCMLFNFKEYLIEDLMSQQKFNIYTRRFRYLNLDTANIYSKEQLDEWQEKYDINDFDLCMFVSADEIKNPSTLPIKLSSKDLRNKKIIHTDTNRTAGFVIEESETTINDDVVYVYVFTARRNARQKHGFNYEIDMRVLNSLNNYGKYSDKWDAYGSLKDKYFETRNDAGKTVSYFDGDSYETIGWEDLPEKFKEEYYWSIKSPGYLNSVDMGSFNRISGYDVEFNPIELDFDKFIFNVGFHDNQNVITEEYVVLMPIEVWQSYLPDIVGNIEQFKSMMHELKKHKLGTKKEHGIRTAETELEWHEFANKYKSLCEDSMIKLRFKRDSKGQIRIQSAISNNNFRDIVLKQPHIQIK